LFLSSYGSAPSPPFSHRLPDLSLSLSSLACTLYSYSTVCAKLLKLTGERGGPIQKTKKGAGLFQYFILPTDTYVLQGELLLEYPVYQAR
jgi:hypothetical protein